MADEPLKINVDVGLEANKGDLAGLKSDIQSAIAEGASAAGALGSVFDGSKASKELKKVTELAIEKYGLGNVPVNMEVNADKAVDTILSVRDLMLQTREYWQSSLEFGGSLSSDMEQTAKLFSALSTIKLALANTEDVNVMGALYTTATALVDSYEELFVMAKEMGAEERLMGLPTPAELDSVTNELGTVTKYLTTLSEAGVKLNFQVVENETGGVENLLSRQIMRAYQDFLSSNASALGKPVMLKSLEDSVGEASGEASALFAILEELIASVTELDSDGGVANLSGKFQDLYEWVGECDYSTQDFIKAMQRLEGVVSLEGPIQETQQLGAGLEEALGGQSVESVSKLGSEFDNTFNHVEEVVERVGETISSTLEDASHPMEETDLGSDTLLDTVRAKFDDFKAFMGDFYAGYYDFMSNVMEDPTRDLLIHTVEMFSGLKDRIGEIRNEYDSLGSYLKSLVFPSSDAMFPNQSEVQDGLNAELTIAKDGAIIAKEFVNTYNELGDSYQALKVQLEAAQTQLEDVANRMDTIAESPLSVKDPDYKPLAQEATRIRNFIETTTDQMGDIKMRMNIIATDSDAKRELADLDSQVNELKSRLVELRNGFSEAVDNNDLTTMRELEAEYNRVTESIKKLMLERLAFTNNAPDLKMDVTYDPSKLEEYQASMTRLLALVKEPPPTGGLLDASNMDLVKSKIEEIGDMIETIQSRKGTLLEGVAPEAPTQGTPLSDALAGDDKGAKKSLSDVNRHSISVIDSFKRIGSAAKGAFSAISSAFGRIGAVMSKTFAPVIGGVQKLFGLFGKLKNVASSSFNKMGKSSNGFLKKMLMVGLGVRGIMALVRRLRTQVIDAFKMMASAAPEFNAQVSSMLTAFDQLKGSTAAAFQPIASVVIPIIERLCGALTTAINTLGTFFAVLTGQGFLYKYTAANKEFAKSVGGASGAVKEAKKTLMGFDELNLLNGANDGGGGGGGAADQGKFEKMPAEDVTNEFANLVDKAWNELDGDFTQVGIAIANKFKEMFEMLDNWILTKGAPLIEKIARSTYTLLNGFFSDLDLANTIGKTLGDGIGAIVNGLHTLLGGIDFKAIGTFLSTGVNSLLENLDFTKIGSVIGKAITAIPTIIASFIEGLDVGLVAVKFGEFINFLLLELNRFLTDTNWVEIGSKFGQLIMGLFENVNFETLGNTVSNAILAIPKMVLGALNELDPELISSKLSQFINTSFNNFYNFLSTVKWDAIGAKIGKSLSKTFAKIDFNKIGKTFGEMLMALPRTLIGIINNLDFKSVGASIAEFFNGVFDSISFEELMGGVIDFINGLTTSISTFLQKADWAKVATDLGKAFQSIFDNLDFNALSQTIGQVVNTIVEVLIKFFDQQDSFGQGMQITAFVTSLFGQIDWLSVGELLLKGIGNSIIFLGGSLPGLFEGLLEAFKSEMILLAGHIGEGFEEGVRNAFANVEAWVATYIVDPFINFFKQLLGIHSPSTVTNEIGGYVVEGFLNGIKDMPSKAMEVITDVKDNIEKVLGDLWTNVTTWASNAFDSFTTWIGNIWEKLTTWTGDIWTKVTTWLSNLWSDIKKWFSDSWDGITTWFSDVLGKVGEWIGNIWDSISKWWSNTSTTVSGWLGDGIKAIVDFFSSIWTKLVTWFGTVTGKISESWGTITGAVANIWDTFKTTLSGIFSGISTNIGTALEGIKKTFTDIFDNIQGIVKGAVNNIIGFINSLISSVVSGINNVINTLNKTSFTIPDWIPEIGGNTYGLSIPNISSVPQIPMLAKGAVIPPNQEFLAMLGDQKSGTNIEAPLDTIKQAVAEELGDFITAMMTGFQSVVEAIDNKDMDVSIGDRAIAEAMDRYNRRKSARFGGT